MRRASQRAIAIEAERGAGFCSPKDRLGRHQSVTAKNHASLVLQWVGRSCAISGRSECDAGMAEILPRSTPRTPGATAARAAAVSPILTDRLVEPGNGAASLAPKLDSLSGRCYLGAAPFIATDPCGSCNEPTR
jgi:hypothetical protein